MVIFTCELDFVAKKNKNRVGVDFSNLLLAAAPTCQEAKRCYKSLFGPFPQKFLEEQTRASHFTQNKKMAPLSVCECNSYTLISLHR